ncbi:TIGR02281 family clan AA aspartic protease [Sphingomonas sp. ID1715]|uniref:retropepsin-like aspartic protease family protein n=1 Tax=Sphingomonas sp. ID1715 TaxID=1656898 RepID=UPI001489CBF6|nr:TIGR02281 family clan AA aspartic protease [Sphingomonas sp. ID1715]NNM78197.1 TIGR02281 family clan AA aspartic protease [Sphingomonas sp. ID1715]
MRLPLLTAILCGVFLGLIWPSAEPGGSAAAVRSDKPHKTVLERSSSGSFFVTAQVNGQPVQFVVDTGAETVALTKEDATRAGVPFDPAEFTKVGRSASGDAIGQEVHIKSIDVDGKKRDDVGGVVLEGLDVSLLGQNYLRRLDAVQISGDKMILH